MVEPGDIIQITNEVNKWFPCLLIVKEVKSWGIRAFILVPDPQGTKRAYYTLENGDFEKVGAAIYTVSDREEQ